MFLGLDCKLFVEMWYGILRIEFIEKSLSESPSLAEGISVVCYIVRIFQLNENRFLIHKISHFNSSFICILK